MLNLASPETILVPREDKGSYLFNTVVPKSNDQKLQSPVSACPKWRHPPHPVMHSIYGISVSKSSVLQERKSSAGLKRVTISRSRASCYTFPQARASRYILYVSDFIRHLSLKPVINCLITAAVLPLLAAKQRVTHKNDWMSTDALVACPDPNCKSLLKIVRMGIRIFSHADTTIVGLEGNSWSIDHYSKWYHSCKY
jgi:hypothetical protein